MRDIILVGYGGHGKSVADSIKKQNEYRIIGYTDYKKQDSEFEYLGTDDVLDEYYDQGVRCAAVCIGYLGKGDLRQRIYDNLKRIGYELPVIIDPSAIVSESAIVEEGSFIGKGSIVNAEAHIGKMVIINTKSLVEHECIVKDFSHVAVGAVLCGQVEVGEACLIGANATVIQCKTIKPYHIVPAGMTIR